MKRTLNNAMAVDAMIYEYIFKNLKRKQKTHQIGYEKPAIKTLNGSNTVYLLLSVRNTVSQ